MAERLDLQGMMSGTREANPFMPLLDEIFAPGAGYGAFEGSGTMASRQPTFASMPDLVSQGDEDLGITAWDSLFGEGGQVLDPAALLRTLNAGQLLSERPMSQSGFLDKYGIEDPGGLGNRYAGVQSAYGGAREFNDADLVDWVKSIGYGGNQSEQINFDPGNLRFGSYDLGGGVNLQDTTLDALNQWAMQNYGVDLQRLAASTNELLSTRQAWMDDPSLWFNPDDPGAIQATAIPGLMDEDQAARLQQYGEAWAQMQDEMAQRQAMGYQGLLDQALLGDAEYGRTAGGQHMLGSVGPTMGYAAPASPVQDYSFVAAQGAFREQLAQMLAQSGLGF